jgi:hypothetical protein
LITADQLLAHAIGDYILQSDWMAQNKTKANLPAYVHAMTYSLLFLVFRPSIFAFLAIFWTHFFIDRYRLARYVVWAKNWMGPYYERVAIAFNPGPHKYVEHQWRRKNPTPSFPECSATGYPTSAPPWLAVWLLIIADNICHVLINGLALRYL